MSTQLTDPIQRLRAISRDADTLIETAPRGDLSAARLLIGSVSQSSGSLSRVIAASPHSVSSVHLARFCTAAETSLNGLRHLIKLYGEDPSPDQIETDAETDLENVVNGLSAFAKKARQDSVQSLRSDVQSTLEVIPAWDMPETSKPKDDHYAGSSGKLAASFLLGLSENSGPSNLPAISATSNFMKRIFKKSEVSAARRQIAARMTDAEMNALFTQENPFSSYGENTLSDDMKTKSRLKIKIFGHKTYVFENDYLNNAGLRISLGAYDRSEDDDRYLFGLFTIMLKDEAPKIRTNLWNSLVAATIGDPDVYCRALQFREDPDFRRSLKETIANALTTIEEQIEAGVPFPHASIGSPVVAAAISGTLICMGATPKGLRSYNTFERSDPFHLRSALEKIQQDHPGIALKEDGGVLSMGKVNSVEAPQGVSKKVYELSDFTADFLRAIPQKNFPYGGFDHTLPRVLTVSAAAVSLIPDLEAHVNSMIESLKADGFGTMRETFVAHPSDKCVFRTVPLQNGDVRIEMGSVIALETYDHPDLPRPAAEEDLRI